MTEPAPAAVVCAHCRAAVVLARTVDTDLPLVLDAEPSPHGRILLSTRAHDGQLVGGVAAPGTARSARVIGRSTFVDHADTCPFASAWVRPPKRRRTGSSAGRRRG